jgi:hypothetical protein
MLTGVYPPLVLALALSTALVVGAVVGAVWAMWEERKGGK